MKAAKVLIQGGWRKLKLQMEFKRVNDRFSKKRNIINLTVMRLIKSLAFHFINFLHCLKYHFKKQQIKIPTRNLY